MFSNSNQFCNNGQDSDFGANSLAASERGNDDNEMNNENKERKLSQLSRPEAKLSKTSKTSKAQTLEDRILENYRRKTLTETDKDKDKNNNKKSGKKR